MPANIVTAKQAIELQKNFPPQPLSDGSTDLDSFKLDLPQVDLSRKQYVAVLKQPTLKQIKPGSFLLEEEKTSLLSFITSSKSKTQERMDVNARNQFNSHPRREYYSCYPNKNGYHENFIDQARQNDYLDDQAPFEHSNTFDRGYSKIFNRNGLTNRPN